MPKFVLQDTNEFINQVDYSDSEVSNETHKAAWHLAQYSKRDVDKFLEEEPEEREFALQHLLENVIENALTGVAQLGVVFTQKDAMAALLNASRNNARGAQN
jgi:hypothetical protein